MLRKRWRGSDAFILIRVLAWMPADVQMNGSNSNAHAQWFSHWKIRGRWLWCYEMMSWGSLMLLREGTIKGEHQAFRSINKPQTLYFGCLSASCGEEYNQKWIVWFVYPYACTQTFLGNFQLVWLWLFDVSWGRSLPTSPWTWYQVKHRSQPFCSRLWGWDKLLVWCESLPVHLVYLCTPMELSHF